MFKRAQDALGATVWWPEEMENSGCGTVSLTASPCRRSSWLSRHGRRLLCCQSHCGGSHTILFRHLALHGVRGTRLMQQVTAAGRHHRGILSIFDPRSCYSLSSAAGVSRYAIGEVRRGSISVFCFQYTKEVEAMGICDYNERKKKSPKE
jgi:hypothetical protein